MKALILAAGYATRLYPLTLDKPKALLPIQGQKAILDYMVDQLEELEEISEIILVSNSRFYHSFLDWARSRTIRKKVLILDDGTTSVDNRLGAIGDLQFAVEKAGIREDLLVLAGDNLFTFELKRYVDYFYRSCKDCVLVQKLDDEKELRRVGVVELDSEGKVLSFEEKPQFPRTNIGVYAIYIYRRDTLPLVEQYLREGNNPDAPSHFPEWLHTRKEVRAYFADGSCYDIGTHEAYRDIRKLFAGCE